jgi:hypothetical protein
MPSLRRSPIRYLESVTDTGETWPLLTRLMREVSRSTPDLAARMVSAIRTLDFYSSGDHVPIPELEASVRAHLAALVESPASDIDRDAAPRELGERRARDGVPLSDVLDALRTGSRFVWDEMVDHARRTGIASDTDLVGLASQVWFMHDAFSQATTTGYRHESSRALLDRQQERLGMVYGLLTARGREAASPWAAIDRLGLPRLGGYVVVAAEATSGRMPLPRVEQSLAEARVASAWVMTSSVQLGIVSTVVPEWAQLLPAATAAWVPTAGVSPRFLDFARVGSAVRLARTALAAAPPRTIRFFTDDPVSMSAAGSPDVSDVVAEEVLGGLLAVPEPERGTLIETLSAWYRLGGSFSAVATELSVHRNTVRNRIHRVGELTDRDVARPRDAAELYLALSSYVQRGRAR